MKMEKQDLEMILEFIKEHKDEIREVLGIEKVYIPQPYPTYPTHPVCPTAPYSPTPYPLEPWRPWYMIWGGTSTPM